MTFFQVDILFKVFASDAYGNSNHQRLREDGRVAGAVPTHSAQPRAFLQPHSAPSVCPLRQNSHSRFADFGD